MNIFENIFSKKAKIGDAPEAIKPERVEYNKDTLVEAFSTLVPEGGITEENISETINRANLSEDEIDLVIKALEEGDAMESLEFDITREKINTARTLLKLEGK